MSSRARRATLLECQNAWDKQVALDAGYVGHTNHQTVVVDGYSQEFVVLKNGPRAGERLRYPSHLEAELHNARAWSRKKASKLPSISS